MDHGYVEPAAAKIQERRDRPLIEQRAEGDYQRVWGSRRRGSTRMSFHA